MRIYQYEINKCSRSLSTDYSTKSQVRDRSKEKEDQGSLVIILLFH